MRTSQTTAWELVHALYSAYESNDRELAVASRGRLHVQQPAGPSSRPEQYFERCWPNSQMIRQLRFLTVLEQDGEVFVTYELDKTDGTRGRNTEFFIVNDDKITKTDVYFGPSL